MLYTYTSPYYKKSQRNNMKFLILTGLFITLACALDSFSPLPTYAPKDLNKVYLGKRLFFDSLLSSDKKISCASCHQFDKGGADAQKVAIGVEGRKGKLNTPSIFNTSLNITQGWTSSDTSIHQRSKAAFLNPLEMNGNLLKTLKYLESDPNYTRMFEKSYQKIDEKALFDAMEAYILTLLTPSAFDAYLKGDKTAISEKAKRGLAIFQTKGCVACHNGRNIGGNMFQKLGIFDEENLKRDKNTGRYSITKKEIDRYVFKVPSLRNVTLTAPYLHDGSISTLDETIQMIGRHQLGIEFDANEVDEIEAFLETLSGKLSNEY